MATRRRGARVELATSWRRPKSEPRPLRFRRAWGDFGAQMEPISITGLPSDALSLVLSKLCLVRNIKGVKRVCKAFRDAAADAEKVHRRACRRERGCVWAARWRR